MLEVLLGPSLGDMRQEESSSRRGTVQEQEVVQAASKGSSRANAECRRVKHQKRDAVHLGEQRAQASIEFALAGEQLLRVHLQLQLFLQHERG